MQACMLHIRCIIQAEELHGDIICTVISYTSLKLSTEDTLRLSYSAAVQIY